MTEFEYDCLQKKLIGRGAHCRPNRRMVTLPSDHLDEAALQRYNGPCRVYRMGAPMDITQFRAMPQDLQRAYLRRLRLRGGSDESVGRMLGVSTQQLSQLRARYRVTFDQPDPAAWAAFLGR